MQWNKNSLHALITVKNHERPNKQTNTSHSDSSCTMNYTWSHAITKQRTVLNMAYQYLWLQVSIGRWSFIVCYLSGFTTAYLDDHVAGGSTRSGGTPAWLLPITGDRHRGEAIDVVKGRYGPRWLYATTIRVKQKQRQ